MNLHYSYLFSRKTYYIMLSLVLVYLIGVTYFSRFYLSEAELLFDREFYNNEYMLESINLGKIMIVLFNFVLITNSFVFNKYDYFLISRKPRKKVIFSKIFIVFIISTIYTFMLVILLYLIPSFLTPYMLPDNFFIIARLLAVFSAYYLALFTFIIIIFKHIYFLFFSFAGFLVSFLSSEFLIEKNQSSSFNAFISLLFPDITRFINFGYDFLYGSIFVLSLTICLILVSIKHYTICDI